MSATTSLDGPGAVHIERIVRECIAARTPAPTTDTRLDAHVQKIVDQAPPLSERQRETIARILGGYR